MSSTLGCSRKKVKTDHIFLVGRICGNSVKVVTMLVFRLVLLIILGMVTFNMTLKCYY